MSGIAKINERQEQASADSGSGMELWLRDGDNAYVSIVVTGADNSDNRLDDFWTHTEEFTRDGGGTGWQTYFCEKKIDGSKDCKFCDSGDLASHRFGFWAFVHQVLHATQSDDSWEQIATPSGKPAYKEAINEFRMFERGWGRGNALWNQLLDIFNEDGDLSKRITRIRRAGTGRDTTYSITSTNHASPLTDEQKEEAKSLGDVRDFYSNKLLSSSDNSDATNDDVEENAIDAMFDSNDSGEDDSLDGLF